jgi:serine/threonine-protein kinase
MTPERWREVTQIYGAVLSQAPEQRSAAVVELCGTDQELRHEIESLLASQHGASLLDRPAGDHVSVMQMVVPIGSQIGVFRVDSLLGVGGMGEVYRARDTKLNREVAIKILPPAFANDPDRLARFKREAQVLASLNHPNIAAIHGFEDADGVHALVLELVDGPTLADRIARGPLPIDEAIAIARQMADALECAHEHGIVHRDLKPANIKVRDDGRVKVLDFGLAKLAEPAAVASPGQLTQSPTITTPAMTAAGIILGTAAYMSPEQAKGMPADKRSDIWAFGCVLYEMLTGKRAFDGEDVSDTLAAILRSEPDWSALPQEAPECVRLLLRKCFEKDRGRRISNIGTARFLISDAIDLPASSDVSQSSASPLHSAIRWWPIAAVVVASTIVGAVVWALKSSVPMQGTTRLTYQLPDGQQFTNAGRKLIALSRDGTKTAYVANGRLYVKAADRLDATPITVNDDPDGAEGVTTPAFSPDGRWIAYWSGKGPTLRKSASTGGAPVVLCDAENPFGISWDDDGILVGQGAKGIMRVSAAGGRPQVLVPAKDDEELAMPERLPGGRMLMYTVARRGAGTGVGRWDKAQIVVQSVGSSERTVVLDGGSDGHYVATGHLIYAVAGALFAVRFDLPRARIVGVPTPVVEGVRRSSIGVTSAANFAVSQTGVLAYVPGSAGGSSLRDLALLDRGVLQPLKLTPRPYYFPRVPPDGRKVAVTVDDGSDGDIWIVDLSSPTRPYRLTFGGRNRFATWTSNSERVAFQSDREGDRAIYWQRADSPGGQVERLTRPEKGQDHIPSSWSPRDEVLLFTVATGSESAMWTLSRSRNVAEPFDDVRETGAQPNGAFSPDGKWIAYNLIESAGRSPAVFVQPYPATGQKNLVSTGVNPMWSRDGKTLFLSQTIGAGGSFASFGISADRGFAVSGPAIWPRPGAYLVGGLPRNYDLLPDAQRFVIVVDAGETGSLAGLRIEYVLNWFDELKQKVPVP